MLQSLPVRCFAPRMIKNPRFRFNKGSPDAWKYFYNKRVFWYDYEENLFIQIPCGKCYLCKRKRANSWRIRLIEELKTCPRVYHEGKEKYRCLFVTFTFADEYLPKSDRRDFYAEYIRKWRDLWRKKYGKSPRYFMTTDKGSQFGRIHFHCLLFNPYDYKNNCPLEIEDLLLNRCMWRYGFIDRELDWLRGFEGVTYVTGYITGSNLEKDAQKHGKPICKEALEYIPYIFVSNGLGKAFVEKNKNLSAQLQPLYELNGYFYSLPTYYRNKLVDYTFRWHSNLTFKKECEDYVSSADTVFYDLQGSKYTFDTLERYYWMLYSKFDSYKKFTIKNYAEK